jgi:uncharacterized protein (DUF362 family)
MPCDRASSRRNFLRTALAGAAGFAAGNRPLAAMATGAPVEARAHSRVSVARDPYLRTPGVVRVGMPPEETGPVDRKRIAGLLDRVIEGLFPNDDPVHSWSRIVHPGEMVAIKVNTLGGRGLSSSVALVDAICGRLQESGVRAENIVIFDRDTAELERAGFRIRTGGAGVQCYGSDRAGFEDDLVEWGSVGSRLSKILTRRANVLINVPVLKDHDGAGVSMALKNMFGVIHNPNKFHPDGCNPYVADVNMLPEIRSRLRLTILDATSACYEGGPAFKPEFTWRPNALMASEDPVALDTVGWQTIERKRAEKGLKTLEADGRAPHYIATAADQEHRLGNNDLRRITVVERQVE